MPLNGSLRDLGVAEIVQFPAASRRCGLLVLERDEERAELYYQKGELHHATLGALEGFPVLVEILPWRRGSFRFEPDLPPPRRSIDMDLGRALFQATLQGDETNAGGAGGLPEHTEHTEHIEATERAEHAEHAEPTSPHGPSRRPGRSATLTPQSVLSTTPLHHHFGPTWHPPTFARLTTFLAEHPLFFYACVMNRRGQVRAEFIRPRDDLEGQAETYGLLKDIMKNYARCCEQRLITESSHCTVAIQPLSGDCVILALAAPGEDLARTEEALGTLALSLEDPLIG